MSDETFQTLSTQSSFKFSGVNLNTLQASEYTLVTIVVDKSSSVDNFRKGLNDCVKTAVNSCKKSPRNQNLLIRVVTFNHVIEEVHGFRPLENIDIAEYDNLVRPSGSTALFDAVQSSIEATYEYAKILNDQDYSVNAVVYIITDGEDNQSKSTANTIKQFLDSVSKSEDAFESISVILIGVGYGNVSRYLDDFRNKAGLNQFVDMTALFQNGSAENVLAKLAGYISQSISSTSVALQNGNSQPIASAILLF